jgi:hypothetical protein
MTQLVNPSVLAVWLTSHPAVSLQMPLCVDGYPMTGANTSTITLPLCTPFISISTMFPLNFTYFPFLFSPHTFSLSLHLSLPIFPSHIALYQYSEKMYSIGLPTSVPSGALPMRESCFPPKSTDSQRKHVDYCTISTVSSVTRNIGQW